MSAVLFGSISTLADTSELQRDAFNKAFTAAGLDWSWSQEDYRAMLDSNGGAARIAQYASSKGQTVDAKAIHASKSDIFQKSLAGGVSVRAGVLETIQEAKAAGRKVALVTTTSPENVQQLLAALSPAVQASDFALVLDSTSVATSKPDSAVYELALSQLGEAADGCVAIEDNVGGVASATGAGLTCVAFPNENTVGHDFVGASVVVSELDPTTLFAG